jgi:dienelactone hydrolase
VTDLAKDNSIDPNRIHLIGWSFGGGASFSALALAERQSVKINSVVAFFPFCRGALAWKQPTPVLTLVGLADDIAPFAQCKDLVKDALDDKSMRVVEYPASISLPSPPRSKGPTARLAITRRLRPNRGRNWRPCRM